MIKPLSFIKKGRVVTIQNIAGCPQHKRHLEEMGFIPGTPLEVCRCCQQGPLLEMGVPTLINLSIGVTCYPLA